MVFGIVRGARRALTRTASFPARSSSLAAVLAALLAASPALAQDADEPRLGEQIAPLVPERLGEWVSIGAGYHFNVIGAEATYEKEGVDCPVTLYIGHGSDLQESFREIVDRGRAQGEDAIRALERPGGPAFLMRDGGSVGLTAFPGGVAVLLQPGLDDRHCAPDDPEAMAEELVAMYDGLDPERMASFEPGGSGSAPDVPTPSGYSAVSAGFDGVRLGLAHPEGWASMDLSELSPMLRGVSAVSDPAAMEILFGDGLEMSSSARHRLGTPENVAVSVALIGEGLDPERMLSTMTDDASLGDLEVVRPVSETSIAGRTAYASTVRGLDEDDRRVVLRQVLFDAGGPLVQVTVLRPAEVPPEAEARIDRVLETVTVEAP